MTMIKALLTHLYLLLTIQHDGRGLPTRLPGILLMVALSIGTHLFLYPPSSNLDIASILISPLLIYWINRRVLSGFMLILTVTIIERYLLEQAGLAHALMISHVHLLILMTGFFILDLKRKATEEGPQQ